MRAVRPVVCERVRAQVSLQLDGELSELERRMLESHLGRCSECAGYARDVSSITELLRDAPLEPLPAPIAVPRPRRVSVPWGQVGAAAALVVAVLGVAVQFSEPGRERSRTAPSFSGPMRVESYGELEREVQMILAGRHEGSTLPI
jgi:anti-sigma factor RsiW